LSADAARTISRRTSHSLDLLNFFLADVRDGLGPYLSIYLLLTHHWDQASIGFVMGVGGIAAIIAQTPVGAFVDRTTAKRALVIAGAVKVTNRGPGDATVSSRTGPGGSTSAWVR
jgi:MFS family permease